MTPDEADEGWVISGTCVGASLSSASASEAEHTVADSKVPGMGSRGANKWEVQNGDLRTHIRSTTSMYGLPYEWLEICTHKYGLQVPLLVVLRTYSICLEEAREGTSVCTCLPHSWSTPLISFGASLSSAGIPSRANHPPELLVWPAVEFQLEESRSPKVPDYSYVD